MKFFVTVSLFLYVVVPAMTFAQDPECEVADDGISYCIESPLNVETFEGLLTAILNTLLIFAVPLIVICIIYAGFSYVTAQGNPEKVTTATRMLTYALIGGVLILGAVALAEVIRTLVESFGSSAASVPAGYQLVDQSTTDQTYL